MTPVEPKTIVRDAAPVASPAPAPRTGMIAWLGDFIIAGLARCCCAHYAMHPDLLGLSERPYHKSAVQKAARPERGA